jgi:hypothetical protein
MHGWALVAEYDALSDHAVLPVVADPNGFDAPSA